ncbi:U3 snoRNP protein [Coemansia sp. RSA 552]|nr:U3 snoRNP protein [Coemansia sp. RSA 552]
MARQEAQATAAESGPEETRMEVEESKESGKRGDRRTALNSEVMALGEARLLAKTNLVRLQADEVVQATAVRAGTKAARGVDAALRDVRAALAAMEETPELTAAEAHAYARSRGTAISLPMDIPAGVRIAAAAPEAVAVAGSYAVGMAVRAADGNVTVDLAAQMPARLFQERDTLDGRYLAKRAFFVAMAQAQLKRTLGNEYTVAVELQRGDARLPVVVVRRGAVVVRVLPSVASSVLALRRLGPDRGNLRSQPGATPRYNAAVAGDALLLTHAAFLHETTGGCDTFAAAAALLRVWMAQRTARRVGVQNGQVQDQRLADVRHANGFVLTMVLAWLVRSGALSPALGALALFRGTIDFVARRDFEAQPLFFGSANTLETQDGSAVFVDPSGTVNMLGSAQRWELTELRMAARQTATDLAGSRASVDRIFLSAALAGLAKYDHVLRVEVDMEQVLAEPTAQDTDCGGSVAAVQHRLATLLGDALQRQASLVAIIPASTGGIFYVGLVADIAEAWRVVALGPNPDAEPEAAAQFRGWWGDRAELRRFRDGAIRLAAVWGDADMPADRRALLLPRMAAFLLRRHFGVGSDLLQPEDLECASTDRREAGHAFCLDASLSAFARTRDRNEELGFEPANAAFDQLQREIKGLEDSLPLRVLALHPVAPGLRYSALAPPKPLADSRADDAFIEPLHVLVEFARSSKWPDEATALHKVKAAFLLRLADSYAAAHPQAQVDVANRFYGYGPADGLLTGADSAESAFEQDSFVDLRNPETGLTFRLSILCEAEGALLRRKAADLRAANVADQAAAVDAAVRRWTRQNVWRPRHHRLVFDLCQRFHPAASLAIRLLKRWLSRHMLLDSSAVPEEVAELLVARIFADPCDGLQPPASAHAAFVRVLQLLATWRWKEDMCAVDFDVIVGTHDPDGAATNRQPVTDGIWTTTGMSADAYAALQTAFDDAKKSGALRLATVDDPSAQWWGSVPPILTRRLQSLAAASLRAIDRCLESGTDSDLPQVFTTPLDDYDFIIKLDSDAVCRKYEQPPQTALDKSAVEGVAKPEVFKNLVPKKRLATNHPNPFGQPGMVGFDPVHLFVRDLEAVYGDSLLLFHDVYGGHCVAGLWAPQTAAPVAFAASSVKFNSEPLPESIKGRRAVGCNKSAILEEIARIGEGLVADIVIQNE